MYKNRNYLLKGFVVFIAAIGLWSCSGDAKEVFVDNIKVSLRSVGHSLLLINQDSTSLVKPVLEIAKNKYQLAFENQLSIHPDSLVTIIRANFEKAELSHYYLTEVIKCNDKQVAYSYEMKENIEKGIVPCGGRTLRKGCYYITVRFIETERKPFYGAKSVYLFGFVVLALLILLIYKRKKTGKTNLKRIDNNFVTLGSFQFYSEENKLVKQTVEINLSKKECDILTLFVANPNKVIKREELMKKIWEDNGVIVGRSLDTYISKLRKILKEDASIKITNVHGVGYKLEID